MTAGAPRLLPSLSLDDAKIILAKREAGASIRGLTREYDTSLARISEALTMARLSVPDRSAPTRPIPGQCRGCDCLTRKGDMATDWNGITIRKPGTCRRATA